MKCRVVFTTQAREQARAAHEWWFRNRDKAPFLFVDQLDEAVKQLEITPEAGQRVEHRRVRGLRRLVVGKVHAHVYYTYDADGHLVTIVAIWSARRGRHPTIGVT